MGLPHLSGADPPPPPFLTTYPHFLSAVNTDLCDITGEINVNVAGELSADPSTPGFLREHAAHSPFRLKPNMVFHVDRESEVAYTYACIEPGVYSFNVLTRGGDWGEEELQGLVDEADKLTNGTLKVDGVKITDRDAWGECGVDI